MNNNNWKIALEINDDSIKYQNIEYIKKDLIGNGAQAQVFSAEKKVDNVSKGDVAIRIQKRYFKENYDLWETLKKFQWKNTTFPIENLPGGNLVVEFELFDDNLTKIPYDSIGELIDQIAISVAIALQDMHNQKHIHLDVKPENIVFKKIDGVYKFALCDFSSMQQMEKTQAEEVFIQMTPAFAAPEIDLEQMSKGVDDKADVWAYGVSILYLLTNKMIFDETTIEMRRNDYYVKEILSLLIKDQNMRQILQRCLEVEKESRANIKEIISLLEKNKFSHLNLDQIIHEINQEQFKQITNKYKVEIEQKQNEFKSLLPYRQFSDYIENTVGPKLLFLPTFEQFIRL